MRKPTVNQMKWQAILSQTQKALAEITKVTGEIFDETELRPERPQRITEKKLAQLKQTQLDFIHKQVEDVIKNMRIPEAEELTHKVRTKEQYIRHPRISKGKKEYEHHPLTAEQRSERAKKAWQTRFSRMTPEQREQYGKDFAERMKKAREAKELERKGYEAPPEAEEPVPEKDWDEVLGEPLTPEEVQELDYAKGQAGYLVNERDLIDYSVEQTIREYEKDCLYQFRIDNVEQILAKAKSTLGEYEYYKFLSENAEEILSYAYIYLTAYKQISDETRTAYRQLVFIFGRKLEGHAMSMDEAIKMSDEYDSSMDEIE